jgi:mono/diheme cytochrome c family protein
MKFQQSLLTCNLFHNLKAIDDVRLSIIFLLFTMLSIKTSAQMFSKARIREGEKYYNQYGCNACHGKTGKLTADLTKAHEKYDTTTLKSYIYNPRVFGNVQMPVYKETISKAGYAALIDYIRWLGLNTNKKR